MAKAAWIQRRMSRGQFWVTTLALWLVFYFLSSLIDARAWGVAVWLINLPVLVALVGLCVRRLHDLNRSGWWLLVAFVPVLGAVWLVWCLAFTSGTADNNRWGQAPGHVAGDHLQVTF